MNKNKRIDIRLSEQEYKILVKALKGKSISEYLRRLIKEDAKKQNIVS